MGNTNCFLRVVPTLKHYSGIVRPYHMEEAIYSDILCTIFSRIQSGILSSIYFLTFSLASIWQFLSHSIWHSLRRLAEVRQCPLRCGARGWGPAVPTEIWTICGLRLRSGSARWDLALAAAVRHSPLALALAIATQIWSSQLRPSSAHCCLELAGGDGFSADPRLRDCGLLLPFNPTCWWRMGPSWSHLWSGGGRRPPFNCS